MSEDKEEMKLRFLKPVEEIPFRKKERASFYDQIIKEFVESGLKYAMVKEMNTKPVSITLVLRQRLKRRGINNIKVYYRKNKVYLEKLE